MSTGSSSFTVSDCTSLLSCMPKANVNQNTQEFLKWILFGHGAPPRLQPQPFVSSPRGACQHRRSCSANTWKIITELRKLVPSEFPSGVPWNSSKSLELTGCRDKGWDCRERCSPSTCPRLLLQWEGLSDHVFFYEISTWNLWTNHHLAGNCLNYWMSRSHFSLPRSYHFLPALQSPQRGPTWWNASHTWM